jgi:t-SNARE complex subunit (syntaxin)
MPVGRENPYTPAGELEQLVKFARGVRRATSWRRAAGWVIAVVVLLPFIVGLVITVAQHL